MNWGNVPQWITAVVAVLTLIGIGRRLKKPGTVAGKNVIVAVISILLVGIAAIVIMERLSSVEKGLWTAISSQSDTLRNIIVTTRDELLRETAKCIEKHVRGGTEEIGTGLIILQNPATARNEVYQYALKQTDLKGYIFLYGGSYLTAKNHIGKNWRLLTDTEISIISDWFRSNRENERKNLFSLLDMLLSDDTIAGELLTIESYDLKVGPQKEVTCCITLYYKIGIIGGYLGELTLKDVN